MKILLIDNDVFVQKNDELCVYKNTGEFAVELKNLGNDVELFQTKHSVKSDFHTFNLVNKGLRITALRRFNLKLFTYVNAYLVGIWRVIHSDFVYLYYPTNYQYLAFIARLLGKAYGLNVRGERGVTSKISLLLYKYSKVVFTVSPYFTSIAASAGALGITQKPAISFDENDIVANREYQNKGSYEILYLARLDAAKGIYELLESISNLLNLGYEITLRIVGDGIEEAGLKLAVDGLKMSKNVVFEGAVTEKSLIAEFYTQADLFVLPSYHEGFPRTIYEAMIFGTPVVTTFVGGIPYLMMDGYNCFEIKPQSVSSITDKMKMILNNYSVVKPIVENATRTVRDIIDSRKPSHAMVLNHVLKGN